MAKIKKQVLPADSTLYVKGKVVPFPKERLEHFAREGKAMLAAGLPLRVVEEHQSWATPRQIPPDDDVTKAKENEFSRGFVSDFLIDSDNTLWVESDIPRADDPQYRMHLEKETPFVSPRILPEFTDGNGKVWKDVIGHVALTPSPVWAQQKPFGAEMLSPVPVGLSFFEVFGDKEGFDLSLADRVQLKDGKWQPVDLAQDATPAAQDPAPAGAPSLPGPNSGGNAVNSPLATFKALLAAHDPPVVLPDATDETNLLPNLIVAFTALNARAAAGGNPPPDPNARQKAKEEPMTTNLSQTPATPAPAATPVPAAAAPAAVDFSALQTELTELRKRADAAEKRAERSEKQAAGVERKALQDEINRHFLRGAMAPPKATDLSNRLKAVVDLSLLDETDLSMRDLKTELGIIRALPDGTFWTDEQKTAARSQVRMELPPAHVDFSNPNVPKVDVSPEEADKILDETYKQIENRGTLLAGQPTGQTA